MNGVTSALKAKGHSQIPQYYLNMMLFLKSLKKNQMSTNRLLICLIVFSATVIAGLYTYYWEIGFDADKAMVGLIAKRFLVHGDIPIFVWSVGYQGLLFGASLIAMLFKFFGVSPRVLSLEPLLLFPLVLYFFFRLNALFMEKKVALLATLFLVISTHHFYDHILRTVPNYSETFISGLLFLWLYSRLMISLYIQKETFERRHFWQFCGMGFTAGFSFYTYGLVVVFMGAALIHLSVLGFRECWRHLQTGWLQRSEFAVLILNSLFLFVLGQYAWSGQTRISFGRLELCTTAEGLLVCLGLFPIIAIAVWILANWKKFQQVFMTPLLGFLGFAIVGVSPKLYYDFILKGPAIHPMRLDGTLTDFIHRLRWALEGNLIYMDLNFLSAQQRTFFKIGFFAILALIIVWFLFSQARTLYAFVFRRLSSDGVRELNPLVFLPLTVLGAYTLSVMSIAPWFTRYTLPLQCFFATAFSWAFFEAYSSLKASQWFRKTVVIGFAVFLCGRNAFLLAEHATLTQLERPDPQAQIAEWLLAKDIHFAYGDYWYAYSISLITDEKIIVEPLYGAYGPYYGPMVGAASRVAYINPFYEPKIENGVVQIKGKKYRVIERNKVADVNIILLEKLF